jgi:hypothetical protein
MKGTLVETDQGWVVEYAKHAELPLHPEFIEMMDTCFTSKFTHEIEFEIVNETYDEGKECFYAKPITGLIDTSQTVNHIGEVNEMVNHVSDVGKMVDDEIKTLKIILEKVDFYKMGYNRAKETLYTEEQVRKLIEEANYDGQYLHAKSVTSQMMRDNAEAYSNEIIQSLKQGGNK